MSVDEQEALSVQHVVGWWCVPLSSGRIAVFPHPMKPLFIIVDTWAEVTALERPTPTTVVYKTPALKLTMELDL